MESSKDETKTKSPVAMTSDELAQLLGYRIGAKAAELIRDMSGLRSAGIERCLVQFMVRIKLEPGKEVPPAFILKQEMTVGVTVAPVVLALGAASVEVSLALQEGVERGETAEAVAEIPLGLDHASSVQALREELGTATKKGQSVVVDLTTGKSRRSK